MSERVFVNKLRVLSLGTILAAGIGLPGQALAPPIPVDSTPFVVDGLCTFPVQLQFAGKGDVISLPGNRTLVTSPGLSVLVANADRPTQQVKLGITGSFMTSTLPDGSQLTIARGRNLLGDPVAGFVLAVGHFSFVTAQDGTNLVPLSGTGTLTDVCALIS
jgi:hypothetical protein